jgi:thiamine transporter ThiT
MKKLISFLCKTPGIFLVTITVVGISMYLQRENLDERWWIIVFLNVVITVISVTGFSSLLSTDVSNLKAIPIILMSLLTGLSITITALLWSKPDITVQKDYALQRSTFDAMTGILLWAWFALFWNNKYRTKKAELYWAPFYLLLASYIKI